jgi:hypothetical protein
LLGKGNIAHRRDAARSAADLRQPKGTEGDGSGTTSTHAHPPPRPAGLRLGTGTPMLRKSAIITDTAPTLTPAASAHARRENPAHHASTSR